MKEHLITQELLTLAAAGVLNEAEQRQVEQHLQGCEACRAEFDEWIRVAGALKELPIPQAPPRLVVQTQRLLTHFAGIKRRQSSQAGIALLIASSWVFALMTIELFRLFDMPLAEWLKISATTAWITYIGLTWLAAAIAAGLLGKHWRREGRTV
jgi:anti-sigma factor RsiW